MRAAHGCAAPDTSTCIIKHCCVFLLFLDNSASQRQLLSEGSPLLSVPARHYWPIGHLLAVQLTAHPGSHTQRAQNYAKQEFCSTNSSTYPHCSSPVILTLISHLNTRDTSFTVLHPDLELTYQLRTEVIFLLWFLINRCLNKTPIPLHLQSSFMHLLSYCFASESFSISLQRLFLLKCH